MVENRNGGGGTANFSNWTVLATQNALTELQSTVVPLAEINNIAYDKVQTYAMIDKIVANSELSFQNSNGKLNFDLITKSGVYRINSIENAVNAPPVGWGQLLVLHSSGDTLAQIMFNFNSETGLFFVRQGADSDSDGITTWQPWAKFEGTTV